MSKKTIDYKSFSKDGPQAEGNLLNKRWWTLNQTDMPSAIAGICKYIQEHQSGLETQRQISARLYSNTSIMGVNGVSLTKSTPDSSKSKDRISYNVVQSAIDTVVAKFAKNKPKPLFLTSGAKWTLQRRAKKLDKFVDGIFYENRAHELGVELLRDALVFGTGVVHVFAHNNRVKFERVLSSELYVDEVDSFYGNPRQLHRVKNMDRQVLAELFPEHARAIKNVNGATTDTESSYETVSDQVTVAESWHLPSGPDAGDGLHVITINDRILFQEEYEKDFFPFAFIHWSKRLYGFWGQGAAEQVQNIQLEINKLLWVIQRSMHLAGTFKIAMENSSKMVKEHFNNEIGTIVPYTNTPPQYLLPPAVQPEVYAHLQTLKNAAYEQLGVSQLSASSKKPDGLNSGKALREYDDIESDRMTVTGQAYEALYLDLARLSVATASEIYKESKELTVNVPGKKFIETIDWKDVDLTEDEYVLKLYPISSLPDDPSGRLQTIQEYIQGGIIDPQTGRKLLDFPDLEAVEEMANAPDDRIHKTLEAICDEGEFSPPDQYMNLERARMLALQYYNHAKNCDMEEERLELIRTFMTQIDALDAQMNPPQPAQPMPGAGPQANPMPSPQSDLLPNIPGGQAA